MTRVLVRSKCGRKKGVPNKRTLELRDMLEKEAGCPLPVLLVRWAKKAFALGEPGAAIAALAQATRYGYPTLKPLEKDANQGPVRVLVVRAADAPGTLAPAIRDDDEDEPEAKPIEARVTGA